MTIERFTTKEHRFLSNFYMNPVHVCFPDVGACYTFPSSENAYQAAKCPSRAREFLTLSPGDAKKLGNEATLREDWEDVKDDIMRDIVLAKFSQNPELAEMLLDTGEQELIEGNTWGDTYWGVCDGVGQNKLGRILMDVREELRGARTDER